MTKRNHMYLPVCSLPLIVAIVVVVDVAIEINGALSRQLTKKKMRSAIDVDNDHHENKYITE